MPDEGCDGARETGATTSDAIRSEQRTYRTGYVQCSRPNLHVPADEGEQDHGCDTLAVGHRTEREINKLTYPIGGIVGAFAIIFDTKDRRASSWSGRVGASPNDATHDRTIVTDEADAVDVP